MTAVRVVIEGRVQGVGFRAWVVREARQRKLTGWVRNRYDGSVEAILSGQEEDVLQMVQACHSGPSLAIVASVIAAAAEDGGWPEFTARPDA